MLIGSMTKLKMGPSDWLFDIKDWLGMWEVTRWLPDFPHAVGRLRQKERMSNLFLSWRQVIERDKKVGFFCCGISTWIFASHLSEYPSFKIEVLEVRSCLDYLSSRNDSFFQHLCFPVVSFGSWSLCPARVLKVGTAAMLRTSGGGGVVPLLFELPPEWETGRPGPFLTV